jgi:cob(I)alamin adenosyltransferase
MEKAYVQVYTGNGKGKTTAMLGLLLRASGAGLRVYIGQFIKSMEYNEITAIKKYLPDVDVWQYGTGCIFHRNPSEADIEAAENGFRKAVEAVFSGKYDIVMLDEINNAVSLGLIDVREVVDLIRKKPQNVELILTGRNAAAQIIEAADLVTEMAEIKHYYNAGVMAREGIEK